MRARRTRGCPAAQESDGRSVRPMRQVRPARLPRCRVRLRVPVRPLCASRGARRGGRSRRRAVRPRRRPGSAGGRLRLGAPGEGMKAPQRRKLFDRIYARDGGRCVYCGAIARRPGPGVRRTPDLATLDHVVPRSKGGRLECGNLVLACRACNNERGIMDAGAFHARKARGARDRNAKSPARGTGEASSLRRRQEGSDLGGSGDDLLSRVLRHSTMGAEAFNGRVRDGIGFWAPRSSHRTGQGQCDRRERLRA